MAAGPIRAVDRTRDHRGIDIEGRAQPALAWVLRDARVTSVLIGASSVDQLEDSLDALANLDFSADELDRIDQHTVEGGINLWKTSSTA